MNGFFYIFVWTGLVCGVWISCLDAQSSLELPSQEVIAYAVSKVDASVVQIETVGGLDHVGGHRVTDQARTGIIVGRDGFIITAAFNLAHDPTAIFVRFSNGTRLAARIVSRNHARRVILLRVETESPLVPIPFADDSVALVGQSAIAIGRSMDLRQVNISTGIVSALNRIWGKAIQTDAGVSPHNFGGPLIDLDGKAIGILVPMSPKETGPADGTEWYDSGVGFAVPLGELRLTDMFAGKDLVAGRLGVSFKEDRGYASLAIVSACPGNSPAGIGGIRPGDQITSIDNTIVRRVNQVRHALGNRYAGETIRIGFVRDGQSHEAEVELVDEIKPWHHAMIGVVIGIADNQLRISRVIPNGPADIAAIKSGDDITQFGGKKILVRSELEYELMTREIGDPVELVLRRGNQEMQTTIDLGELSAAPIHFAEGSEIKSGDLVEIKLAESPNVCHGYFPHSTQPSGLLLWIGNPGKLEPNAIIEPWKSWCHSTNTALLIPQSQDAKRWTAEEIEFLNKFADQASSQYDIDPYRIAVGGQATGGIMASMVAMSDRATWRGLILVDSGASRRFDRVQSEPEFRQLVLMVIDQADEKTKTAMELSNRNFRRQAIPVYQATKLTESWQQMVLEWISSLRRL